MEEVNAPTPCQGEENLLLEERTVEANTPKTNHNNRTTRGNAGHDRRPGGPSADPAEGRRKVRTPEDKNQPGTARRGHTQETTDSTRSASQCD